MLPKAQATPEQELRQVKETNMSYFPTQNMKSICALNFDRCKFQKFVLKRWTLSICTFSGFACVIVCIRAGVLVCGDIATANK
jgi:hypothetical protein